VLFNHPQGGDAPTNIKKPSKAPGKPEHCAMPTRFFHNVLILRFWQAQLLDALVKVK
jgi:hypothetical protein